MADGAANRAGRTPAARAVLLAICAFLVVTVSAERLPIRTYTDADGLSTNTANCVVRDSQGFLWLCTRDGLTRFDGYTFVNYNVHEGIPNRHVTAFIQTRRGAYWVGTFDGLARFEPDRMRNGRSPFVQYAIPGSENSRHVTALAEGGDESIWCGTRRGVFTLDRSGGVESVDLGLPNQHSMIGAVQSMAIDRDGSVWIGTGESGLFRRSRDGQVDHFGGSGFIYALMMDRHGRIWAAAGTALYVFDPASGTNRFPVYRVYSQRDGLPSGRSRALLEAADGSIWVATETGVAVLPPDGQGFRSYDARNGFSEVRLRALGEDPEGNIWMAGESALMRVARSGLLTYDTTDGLGGNSFVSAFEGRDGQIYFVNGSRELLINRFDGKRFKAVRPLTRSGNKLIRYMGWGIGQTVLQDHAGEWWIPTGEGLCRFTGIRRFEDLERTPPKAVYTTRDGLPGNDIFHLFEDRKGDIWISTVDTPGLTKWERQSGRFHQIGATEGFVTHNPPTSFAEDGEGDLWVGMLWNGLARLRKGVWRTFSPAEGLPESSLWSMLLDHRDRLWIASSRDGLARIDKPASDHPRFIRYSTRQGLASDLITSIVEDRHGTIYIAGARGVDALDPETNLIRHHFGAADGLAAGDIAAALCDRSGKLWFGATTGLSRLVGGRESRAEPPPIRITRLRIAGVDSPLSGLGEQTISGLRLGAEQNHIDIDFARPSFRTGARLRYQYRLGVRSDWTEPADLHSISLAGLGSGEYRFEVRAVNDGIADVRKAAVSFEVLPPFWRRGWVLTAAAFLFAMLLYAAHRYRIAQTVEMERVRTRIAMDLHDDVGSTLSQIGILSEVARQQSGIGPAAQSLARLAEICREMASSVGDIVWAVNPQRDRGADLVQRMRRFGEDLLNGCNIAFDCTAADTVLSVAIPADVRREVYLIFKESVNNIARHAKCRHATAELTIVLGTLALEVHDDGDGFDTRNGGEGHGLASMQRRAGQIRGALSVHSAPGGGTTVLLKVPLHCYLFR